MVNREGNGEWGVGRYQRPDKAGWAMSLLSGEREQVSSPAWERIPAGEKQNLESDEAFLSPALPSAQGTPWNSSSAIFSLRLGPKG